MALAGHSSLVSGVVLFLFAFVYEVMSDSNCNVDVDKILETLLDPSTDPSIQIKALRSSLVRKLQEALDKLEEENEERQRILATLSRWNNLPESKRNLESLARAGYIKTLPDEEEDANYKRSIANLAKNGQLPMRQDDQKRGIETLARNGDYHMRGDIQNVLNNQMMGKRTLGSLEKNFYLPYNGKRSLSSLAKAGDLRFTEMPPKRNLASLVRDGLYPGPRFVRNFYYPNEATEQPENLADKRNLQALKAQSKQFKRSTKVRTKREIDYENEEYPSPYDYDDLVQDLNSLYPVSDKRFLGSVAKTGWFRQTSSYPKNNPEKRHIGALARLGWLPAFRHTRRFNRSGRSTGLDELCNRETTSDGQTEVDSSTKNEPIPLNEKSTFYIPNNDNFFFRKVFFHPRSH
ncbi:unnamed protein product, partial [Phaedon cochleariae]